MKTITAGSIRRNGEKVTFTIQRVPNSINFEASLFLENKTLTTTLESDEAAKRWIDNQLDVNMPMHRDEDEI